MGVREELVIEAAQSWARLQQAKNPNGIRTMYAVTTPGSCERILFGVFDRMNNHWRKHPLKAFTQNN